MILDRGVGEALLTRSCLSKELKEARAMSPAGARDRAKTLRPDWHFQGLSGWPEWPELSEQGKE